MTENIFHDADSRSALPIYLQISESLIREIAAGRLKNGERLPPERTLAGQFQTTVRTLRKALDEVARHGLLQRIHGSGNYIRAEGSNQGVLRHIYSMFRLELKDGGGLPRAKILSVKQCTKPESLPDFGTSHRANRVRRLRFLNHIPIALEEIWLDYDSGIIDPENVSDSLYYHYQNKLGFWITSAQDYVSVAKVPDWKPEGFMLEVGEAAGYIERFSWAQGTEPVEFSKTWFDPNQSQYVQRLT